MKWFSSKALKKQKLRLRKSPSPQNAPRPKYQTPIQPERGPKIVKPRVELPFIASGLVVMAGNDTSEDALRALDRDAAQFGGIISVEWNLSSNPCPKCQAAHARGPWDSVQDFLNGRDLGVSPKKSLPLGIYGYSHPGCSCSLTVYYASEDSIPSTVSV